MRWYEAALYKREVTGKDKLGHETAEDVEAGTCVVRKAPVKAVQGEIEGNRYKTITRVFLTPTEALEFKGITRVKVWQRMFTLENVASLENGHTMLTCVYHKPEADDESEADS